MYKLRTIQPIVNITFKGCFNRNQLEIVRHFNKRIQQRARPRDEDILNSALNTAFGTREMKSVEDWILIRKELIETTRHLNLTNFDSIALKYCLKTKDYNLAELCFKFIQEENSNLSLSVSGKMFHIYHGMYEDKIFNGNYEDTVLKMYENIRSKYKVLDSLTLEATIMALSATKHWKICLDLLKEIKISCVPNTLSYNYLAAAAFRNREYTVGWKLIYEMINNHRPTGDICYKAILHDCIENNSKQNMDKLFEFFNNFDIICSFEVCNLIEEASLKFKYKQKSAILDEMGKCSNCEICLPRISLSEKEFHELKNVFFDEVVIGKNVFCKTTPEEVDRFKDFLKTAKNYHVVIDGLNVAYATGSENPAVMANILNCVVNYFAVRGKQVLVLGRLHMLKWPKKLVIQMKQNADIFLTQNLSYDDPYLLYCALHSGHNTIVVSRDYMRSHSYLLKSDQHRRLFKRWLSQCRHEFVRVLNNGKVIFNKPLPYLPICQEIESGWHVPFLSNGETITNNTKINNWLCIQK